MFTKMEQRIALTHQETLFLPVNGSKHWSATNSSSEGGSVTAVWLFGSTS